MEDQVEGPIVLESPERPPQGRGSRREREGESPRTRERGRACGPAVCVCELSQNIINTKRLRSSRRLLRKRCPLSDDDSDCPCPLSLPSPSDKGDGAIDFRGGGQEDLETKGRRRTGEEEETRIRPAAWAHFAAANIFMTKTKNTTPHKKKSSACIISSSFLIFVRLIKCGEEERKPCCPTQRPHAVKSPLLLLFILIQSVLRVPTSACIISSSFLMKQVRLESAKEGRVKRLGRLCRLRRGRARQRAAPSPLPVLSEIPISAPHAAGKLSACSTNPSGRMCPVLFQYF